MNRIWRNARIGLTSHQTEKTMMMTVLTRIDLMVRAVNKHATYKKNLKCSKRKTKISLRKKKPNKTA